MSSTLSDMYTGSKRTDRQIDRWTGILRKQNTALYIAWVRSFVSFIIIYTRKLCYSKDDRAMRAI